MTCTMAENAAGGVSRAMFTCDHAGVVQEVTMHNWVLGPGQVFKPGAIYGMAVWWIADGGAQG